MKWFKSFYIFACFVLVLQFFIPLGVSSPDDQISTLITEAEEELVSSYEAVLAAEKTGASVSLLLDQLNLGGNYLSEAYVWNSLGDSENVLHYSSLCYDIAVNVKAEALELGEFLQNQRNSELIALQLGSVTAIVVVLVLSSVIWRVFKRRYCKQILKLKPEVFSNES